MKTLSIYLLFLLACSNAFADDVVEFYNIDLNHYFLTADPNEAVAIDAGSAGPGWFRTGDSFKSGGSTPVCRFYGSMDPGPNSHFYTVDQNECNHLILLEASTPATEKRWNLEGLGFYSTPSESGMCLGTAPVYRAYNNGFATGKDSNHRITSNLSGILRDVFEGGWIAEGTTMCAPLPDSLVLAGKFPRSQFLHLLEGCDTISANKNEGATEPTMDIYINKCKADGSQYPKVYLGTIKGCDNLVMTQGVRENTIEAYVMKCAAPTPSDSEALSTQKKNIDELNASAEQLRKSALRQ